MTEHFQEKQKEAAVGVGMFAAGPGKEEERILNNEHGTRNNEVNSGEAATKPAGGPQIRDDFRDLIPPLSESEREALEASIIAEGVREPLIVWKEQNILLDGHNRAHIALRNGKPVKYEHRSFASEQDAKNWMIENQLSRRNLPPDQAAMLRGLRYNAEKQNSAENLRKGGLGGRSGQGPQAATAERIAKQSGVSARTVKRDGKFAAAVKALKKLDPGIEKKVLSGKGPSRELIVAAAAEFVKGHLIIAQGILDGDVKPPHTEKKPGKDKGKSQPAAKEIENQKSTVITCLMIISKEGEQEPEAVEKAVADIRDYMEQLWPF
jgi:hypothetical protein